jgi:homoserine dehydrogenase
MWTVGRGYQSSGFEHRCAGVPLTPQQVRREGIGGISNQMMQAALGDGERWKLVCRAMRTPGGVDASVQPQRVSPRSPLYSVNGTSSYGGI